MPEVSYRGRRAVQLENGHLRLTVLVEGGHIAEILHKATGVNPLWTPPWPSIEPSSYDPARHPEYGADTESKLLAGIMGHNLCLDLFGSPSPEEAAAGIPAHGEAGVNRYRMEEDGFELKMLATLKEAGLAFERRIRIHGQEVHFTETVENLSAFDRPIAWTQHVNLGPPFLERGVTQFRAPVVNSMALDGECFDWPIFHGEDLRTYTSRPVSSEFHTHLMDPARKQAFFLAHSSEFRLLFGYVWKQADFPWLGIWDENRSRQTPPWNGQTLTRGLEFGVSPIPESRRKMIERGSLFGVPGYRWIPAKSKLKAEYMAFAMEMDEILSDLRS
jgi:hypothetical protein